MSKVPIINIPRIRGTQVGLQPALVDPVKDQMRAGAFDFQAAQNRIGGVRDLRGTYHVIDGHHRMVAALELFHETGDPTPVLDLLRWGKIDNVSDPPRDSRPMPSRTKWGAFRNWVGF